MRGTWDTMGDEGALDGLDINLKTGLKIGVKTFLYLNWESIKRVNKFFNEWRKNVTGNYGKTWENYL